MPLPPLPKIILIRIPKETKKLEALVSDPITVDRSYHVLTHVCVSQVEQVVEGWSSNSYI